MSHPFLRLRNLASAQLPLARGFVWSGMLCLAAQATSAQVTSVWTGDSGDGQWASAGNWSAGVPDGETATADFSQLDLTADRVVDAGNITVNHLVFGDTTPGGGNWYLGDPSFSATFTLAGTAPTITVGNLGTNLVSFNGGNGPLRLAATSGFIKDGPGRLDVAGANAFGGRIVVRAGTLGGPTVAAFNAAETIELAGGNLAFGSGTATFSPTLELTASGSLGLANNSKTLTGAIRGAAGTVLTITQSSGTSATTSLGGSLADFHGEIVFANRYYRLETTYAGSYAASGAGAIWTVNTGVTGAGTGDGSLSYRNGTNATATFDFGALQGTGVLRGGSAAGTGVVIYRIGALGLDTSFSGLFLDGATKAGLTKVGTGTLTLSGANTYTGATLVSAGALLVNGDQSTPVPAGAVLPLIPTTAITVDPDGRLGGSGVIGGDVTVRGTLTPGAGVGTLTFKRNLTLAATGLSILEINAATAGTGHDAVALLNPGDTGVATTTLTYGGTLRLVVADTAPVGDYPLFTTGAQVARAGAFSAVEIRLASATLALSAVNGLWVGESSGRTYAFDPASGEFTLGGGVALTPLQTWRQTHFGTTEATGTAADAADPDGDDVPNLLEYATGGDPAVSGPAPTTLGRNPAGHLTLTFANVTDASVRYLVQASDDLVSWSPILDATGATLGAGPTTATDPELLSGHPRRFLRLSVSLAP